MRVASLGERNLQDHDFMVGLQPLMVRDLRYAIDETLLHSKIGTDSNETWLICLQSFFLKIEN